MVFHTKYELKLIQVFELEKEKFQPVNNIKCIDILTLPPDHKIDVLYDDMKCTLLSLMLDSVAPTTLLTKSLLYIDKTKKNYLIDIIDNDIEEFLIEEKFTDYNLIFYKKSNKKYKCFQFTCNDQHILPSEFINKIYDIKNGMLRLNCLNVKLGFGIYTFDCYEVKYDEIKGGYINGKIPLLSEKYKYVSNPLDFNKNIVIIENNDGKKTLYDIKKDEIATYNKLEVWFDEIYFSNEFLVFCEDKKTHNIGYYDDILNEEKNLLRIKFLFDIHKKKFIQIDSKIDLNNMDDIINTLFDFRTSYNDHTSQKFNVYEKQLLKEYQKKYNGCAFISPFNENFFYDEIKSIGFDSKILDGYKTEVKYTYWKVELDTINRNLFFKYTTCVSPLVELISPLHYSEFEKVYSTIDCIMDENNKFHFLENEQLKKCVINFLKKGDFNLYKYSKEQINKCIEKVQNS